MENSREPRGGLVAFALILALAFIVGCLLLGMQIKAIRLGDKYVTVRGLAERTVKSDLAIWPLEYTETGDDLGELYTKTEADKKVILKFLAQQGIQSSEIAIGVVSVTDKQANEYGNGDRAPHRYIVDQQIAVQSARVDEVAAAAQKTIQLLQSGIVLSSGQRFGSTGPTFKFTSLDAIKPDMITEATQNARAAATRFALDARSTLGSIRQATQGVFVILPANSGSDPGGGEAGETAGSDSSIMKTVRVVTTVDYYLN